MTDTIGATQDRYSTAHTVLPGVAMIAVTFGLARYGYGLLLPEMQSDLAISAGTAGLISSGAYLAYLVANFAVVWLISQFGPRGPVGLAAFLASAGMAVIASATSATGLAVGVFVAGAAAGLAFPPYADIVAQQIPQAGRATAWSTISSGTGWGVAIAGPIAIAFGANWRIAWSIFVVLAVGTGIVATLRAPARSATPQHLPQLSWTWFVCPKSRPLLISAVLLGAGSSVWWAFSVEALRTADLSATWARIIYAVCGAASILASLSGTVINRIGLRPAYLGSCLLLGAALALLAVGAATLLVALSTAVMFGICYSAVIAAQGLWSAQVFAERPSAGLAAVNTALTIGTILGPSLAGALVHHIGFTATLTGAAITVELALFFCPPTARRQEILAAHRCTATPVRD